MQQQLHASDRSSLDGLWVLLVNGGDQTDTRVPMMARSGNEETYLLGFGNMAKARRFLNASEIEGAEPRMVVPSNRTEFLALARQGGAVGVLVDYDPATQQYRAAAELY